MSAPRTPAGRGLVLFFVLAFALPWAVWGTAIAQQRGAIGWHVPGSLAFWLGLPIATFGAAALTGGRTAVVDLLRRMVTVRVAPRWYLVAVLATPVLAVLALAVAVLAGWPTGVGVELPAGALAGALALNVWMWLLTEEAAWRGYALPRLQARFDPLTASLVLGVLWAVWHLPLWWVAGSFQSRLPFAVFALSTVATSVLLGWLVNHARGSVLLAAVLHGVTDVTIAFLGVMTSGTALLWTFVILQVAAAAVVAPDLARRPVGALDRVARGLDRSAVAET